MPEQKMGWVERTKAAFSDTFGTWQSRSLSLQRGEDMRVLIGRPESTSGESVSRGTALQLSAVMACVRLISETISTLPLNVYKTGADGERAIDRLHPLQALLHDEPNADMSADTFLQAYVASMALCGAGYAEFFRSPVSGRITSIQFLPFERVTGSRLRNGSIEWRFNDPVSGWRVIPEDRMWFTPAWTLDGVTPLSPIQMGVNVMGNAMAADRASGRTFKDGMKASGFATVDAILKPEQRHELRKHISDVSQLGGFYILEKGTGFQQLNMTPQDSELLATRLFNVEEVCRWFRVPPFMVGHNAKASGYPASLEQQMIMFVTTVLRSWIVRLEKSAKRCLLTPAEKTRLSFGFVMEGLLRGDSAARAAFYSIMTDKGMMTRDEVREKENLPKMGGKAAILTVQAQMIPLDKIGEEPVVPVATPNPAALPAEDAPAPGAPADNEEDEE